MTSPDPEMGISIFASPVLGNNSKSVQLGGAVLIPGQFGFLLTAFPGFCYQFCFVFQILTHSVLGHLLSEPLVLWQMFWGSFHLQISKGYFLKAL